MSYPISDWTKKELKQEVIALRAQLATATQERDSARSEGAADRARVAVINAAEWISSPSSSNMAGGEWRMHVRKAGFGQSTAYGKTIIEAADRAIEWLARCQSEDAAQQPGRGEGV